MSDPRTTLAVCACGDEINAATGGDCGNCSQVSDSDLARLRAKVSELTARAEKAEAEAKRQKDHNILQQDAVNVERARRKDYERIARSYQQNWTQLSPGGGPLIPEPLAPAWRERIEKAEATISRLRGELTECATDLEVAISYGSAARMAVDSLHRGEGAVAAIARYRSALSSTPETPAKPPETETRYGQITAPTGTYMQNEAPETEPEQSEEGKP